MPDPDNLIDEFYQEFMEEIIKIRHKLQKPKRQVLWWHVSCILLLELDGTCNLCDPRNAVLFLVHNPEVMG